jgi:hypothetical protein
MLDVARERGLSAAELSAFEGWLPTGRVDQKRNDALAMLRHMRTFLERSQTRHEPTFSFEHTQLWERLCQTAGSQGSDAEPLLSDALLEELRVRGQPYFESIQASVLRRLSIAHARRTGIVLSDEDVTEALDSIRRSNRLLEPDDVHAWMATNELNVEGFYHLVEDQAFLRRAASFVCDNPDQYVLDHLRVAGEYFPLLNRAKDKQKKLLDLGLEEPDLAYTGLERERLIAWYFQEHLSVDEPEDLRAYAERLGCSDDDFLRMVLREYFFLTAKTH